MLPPLRVSVPQFRILTRLRRTSLHPKPDASLRRGRRRPPLPKDIRPANATAAIPPSPDRNAGEEMSDGATARQCPPLLPLIRNRTESVPEIHGRMRTVAKGFVLRCTATTQHQPAGPRIDDALLCPHGDTTPYPDPAAHIPGRVLHQHQLGLFAGFGLSCDRHLFRRSGQRRIPQRLHVRPVAIGLPLRSTATAKCRGLIIGGVSHPLGDPASRLRASGHRKALHKQRSAEYENRPLVADRQANLPAHSMNLLFFHNETRFPETTFKPHTKHIPLRHTNTCRHKDRKSLPQKQCASAP